MIVFNPVMYKDKATGFHFACLSRQGPQGQWLWRRARQLMGPMYWLSGEEFYDWPINFWELA